MTPRARTFWLRLFAIAALLLLGAVFACRPAWSPDGSRLLFVSRTNANELAIGLYDRKAGTAEVLFRPEKDVMATPLWTDDGSHAVIVCGKDKTRRSTVVIVPVGERGPVHRFELDRGDDTYAPVLLGGRMFVGGPSITSFDLDGGSAKELVPGAKGDQFLVAAVGKGLAYVRGSNVNKKEWEIGMLDVATGQTTPVLHDDPQLPWDVWLMPAFSPDGSRIALLARSRVDKKNAILVFAGDTFEMALPIEGEAELGNVVWAPDNARLFATLARHDDNGRSWNLVETMVGGSVMRETPIVTTPPIGKDRNGMGLMFQVALSPDGKVAALSTAVLDNVPADQAGLYLVEVQGEHKVRRVPFPVPPPPPEPAIVLVGSDTLRELGAGWSTAFTDAHPELPVRVEGGGSAEGLAALLDGGPAMLAMTSRPARPVELEAAEQRGTPLREHRVGFAPVAIGVHKDNPMPSITLQQLATVFAADEPCLWSDLGVAMPAGKDGARALSPGRNTALPAQFREAALANQRLGRRVKCLPDDELLEALRTEVDAIGLVHCNLDDPAIRLLPVASSAESRAVPPTAANFADGSYPLARPLFVYARSDASPAATAFVQWLASDDGKRVTTRAGFVPAE